MRVTISRRDAGFHDGDATQVAVGSGSIVVNFSNGYAVVVPFDDLENLVVQHTEVVNAAPDTLEALEGLLDCEAFSACTECEHRAERAIAKTRGE